MSGFDVGRETVVTTQRKANRVENRGSKRGQKSVKREKKYNVLGEEGKERKSKERSYEERTSSGRKPGKKDERGKTNR